MREMAAVAPRVKDSPRLLVWGIESNQPLGGGGRGVHIHHPVVAQGPLFCEHKVDKG